MPGSDAVPAEAEILPAPPSRRHVRWPFTAGLALSHVGASFAFAPLLAILVPLKAEAIDAAHKPMLLSALLFWGALMAGGANVLGGALSDATHSRWGRRRPWIFAGLLGSLVSYWVIATAQSATSLLTGVLMFQFCFNLLFAPLVAVFPDRVPDDQKGVVSGFLAMGYPLGSGLGALLVGEALHDTGWRFAAVGLVLTVTVGSFAIRFTDAEPSASAPRAAGTPPQRGAYRDFVFAWSARFLVQVAVFVATAYGVFYLEDVVGYAAVFPGRRPEQGYAVLAAAAMVANVICAVLGGRLSDRAGRRKLFICAAALTIALALLAVALAPAWPLLIAAWTLLGAGMGAFTAVENALIAQILPSPHTTGRDLGIMNLGNTLPQCAAPMLAMLTLKGAHPDYRLLFALAGGLALLGALSVLPVRRVR